VNLVAVSDLVAAQKLAATCSEWVVLRVVDEIKPEVTLFTDDFPGMPNLRQVIIAQGRRYQPRIVGVDIVVLDGESLTQEVLLHSIAIAANRSSPYVHWGNDFTAIKAPILPLADDETALILVAEDDAVNQQVIIRQLKLLGFTAEVAVDGAEALAKWRAGNFELLLADLHMPVMDGYSLAKAIRQEESSGRRLPILAFTANALKGEMNKALAAGMDDYLTKPIQMVELRAALLKWLPSHRGHAS
jgi:CheY-like chemotaxis protein